MDSRLYGWGTAGGRYREGLQMGFSLVGLLVVVLLIVLIVYFVRRA
jgi:hypothetical protein